MPPPQEQRPRPLPQRPRPPPCWPGRSLQQRGLLRQGLRRDAAALPPHKACCRGQVLDLAPLIRSCPPFGDVPTLFGVQPSRPEDRRARFSPHDGVSAPPPAASAGWTHQLALVRAFCQCLSVVVSQLRAERMPTMLPAAAAAAAAATSGAPAAPGSAQARGQQAAAAAAAAPAARAKVWHRAPTSPAGSIDPDLTEHLQFFASLRRLAGCSSCLKPCACHPDTHSRPKDLAISSPSRNPLHTHKKSLLGLFHTCCTSRHLTTWFCREFTVPQVAFTSKSTVTFLHVPPAELPACLC